MASSCAYQSHSWQQEEEGEEEESEEVGGSAYSWKKEEDGEEVGRWRLRPSPCGAPTP